MKHRPADNAEREFAFVAVESPFASTGVSPPHRFAFTMSAPRNSVPPEFLKIFDAGLAVWK